MDKKFKLSADDIRPLKVGLGGCIATDRITVDGYPVSFMYRTEPLDPSDSGWNFFSGVNEDDEYLDDPENSGVYDVNTIANYDKDIIPLLDAPVGSVYERDGSTNTFALVDDFEIPSQ